MSNTNIERYIEQEHLYNTEGEGGVRNLEKLVEAIGYKANGFRYGSSIEVFLQDNPGVIEALQNWIVEANVREWEHEVEPLLESEEDEYESDEAQEWHDFDSDC